MAEGHIETGNCRILISNDDGIEAPGIKLLEKIARGLSDDVWIVAPELDQSGVGKDVEAHGSGLAACREAPRRTQDTHGCASGR